MSGENWVFFANWGYVMDFLASERGATYVSVAIALFGLTCLAFLLRGQARSHAEVLRAIRILSSFDAARASDEFERISSDLGELRVIGSIWKRYSSTLIWSRGKNGAWSTLDPALLWDEEDILGAYINLRWYRSVPNLLTGLGLLGTFIGLVAGIYLARDGLASGDPATMQQGLSQLLGGAYTAFLTSIVGIFMSFVYTTLERWGTRVLSRTTSDFCRFLSARFPARSSDQLLADIWYEAHEQTSQLKGFSNDLAISLGEVMSQQLSATLGPTLIKLVESVDALREEQRIANHSAIEQMISKFRDALSNAAGQELQSLSETLRELNVAAQSIKVMLIDAHEGMRGQLEAGIKALREGMRDVADDLRKGELEAAEVRRRELGEWQASTSSAIQELQSKATEVFETFQRAAVNLREIIEGAGERFDRAVQNLHSTVADLSSVIDAAKRTESERVEQWTHLTEQMGGHCRMLQNCTQRFVLSRRISTMVLRCCSS